MKIPVMSEEDTYVRGRYLYQEEDPMSKEDTSFERKTHFERKEKRDHITTVASTLDAYSGKRVIRPDSGLVKIRASIPITWLVI